MCWLEPCDVRHAGREPAHGASGRTPSPTLPSHRPTQSVQTAAPCKRRASGAGQPHSCPSSCTPAARASAGRRSAAPAGAPPCRRCCCSRSRCRTPPAAAGAGELLSHAARGAAGLLMARSGMPRHRCMLRLQAHTLPTGTGAAPQQGKRPTSQLRCAVSGFWLQSASSARQV